MKTLLQKMREFAVSVDGPIAVEYSVMLALIVMVCFASIILIGSLTGTSFSNVATSTNFSP